MISEDNSSASIAYKGLGKTMKDLYTLFREFVPAASGGNI